ncbi:hypothetical protein CHLRE_09g390050v5 [Chlamydomonas reinhardtii]|uniref:Molybdenum cofactor carrier protein n=1 Tax=Chlamydomonas reinhardtii TaxID=3055 RepID=Q8RV61_CHLRE|nr:uncharacterized protein CHLRE_09g390050v5 [Chlamydomonas reinhardtii]AAK77219.1 molybdenum cofactor carrier protein [Chlamydomonas reinhardtii]AAK77220.1 molybdenum cofactor carrier protein [Chlamydomonas reinhardtii]PNW78610.1 hypothetical protein CHLRE_09g390050v5 [Chlamydomonas reinhardtii]|eukprot:XP_001694446.1 molybdenum cofactor carrier protein [Chlamydomonas reinhardtii]
MSGRKPIIGVMGPGKADTAENQLVMANELGKQIATHGWILLTGGRSLGVMHEAMKGAKEAGGTTIGVLPGPDTSEISDAVDIPIVTGLGSARDNINALSSNVLVAVGMGPGTAAEVALALKAKKPVVLLGTQPEAEKFFTSLDAGLVHVAADVAGAIAAVKQLLA